MLFLLAAPYAIDMICGLVLFYLLVLIIENEERNQ